MERKNFTVKKIKLEESTPCEEYETTYYVNPCVCNAINWSHSNDSYCKKVNISIRNDRSNTVKINSPGKSTCFSHLKTVIKLIFEDILSQSKIINIFLLSADVFCLIPCADTTKVLYNSLSIIDLIVSSETTIPKFNIPYELILGDNVKFVKYERPIKTKEILEKLSLEWTKRKKFPNLKLSFVGGGNLVRSVITNIDYFRLETIKYINKIRVLVSHILKPIIGENHLILFILQSAFIFSTKQFMYITSSGH